MSDSPEPSAGFVEIYCARCGAPMRVASEHLRRVVACPGCDADIEPWRAVGSPNEELVPPPRRPRKKREPDIRKLAKAQRWMILLVLLNLVLQFLPPLFLNAFAPGPSFMIIWGILYLGVYVLMVIGTVLLLNAQGNSLPIVIICGILALFPCVSLILLLLVNMSATRTLRRAGLRVGFMGVGGEDVERVCNPRLCSGCGYDLTGNVTGRCSECGKVIEGLKIEG
ncbi:MAG: hypothetical protein ACE5E5_02190 [Phycisphaerae bacterium]